MPMDLFRWIDLFVHVFQGIHSPHLVVLRGTFLMASMLSMLEEAGEYLGTNPYLGATTLCSLGYFTSLIHMPYKLIKRYSLAMAGILSKFMRFLIPVRSIGMLDADR